MSRLPPLTALRAFESAARNQSFTKAAQELFLTQSAISRHIRNLEELFGMPLFYRSHRMVTLTPEGHTYMHELVGAFARIDLATRKLRSSGKQNVLNLHAYTSFAMNWLIPRLPKFLSVNPEIDVRLTASTAPLDFDQSDIHAAIRTIPGDLKEGVRADKLFNSWLIAVGGPREILSRWPLNHPGDLRNVTLLHSLARPDDWNVWLKSVGVHDINPAKGMKFESSAMAYLAAQQGLGIAIAQNFLVQDDLRKGLLTQVFPNTELSDRSYYLLSSPRHEGSSALETFRQWLLAEIQADKPAYEIPQTHNEPE
ncbi:MAG: transcriptional regulator GcvA [Pollutimonas bauzanensis]|uniref:Transcriptional regulator, LysR family n=1 Tax=Pollutimonas bauzanensis TaxID=658167 RepID=A0A1M5QZG0_9BURK|nr:transcriptional regulator GcvA [Pollutimonas bauzanensis]SHH18923.1 transcriptional regulator, LysR family [Pollutimonas bauzanensis]